MVHATWITSFVLIPLLPAAQNLIASHAKAASVLGGAAVIIAKLTKSPTE